MNNTSKNKDITSNNEAMNLNINATEENQMYNPATMPDLAGNNAVVYPELYYKLQPHIMMMCDQMDAYGMLPTKENMENASNQLHDNVLMQHPEMAEYDKMDNENQNELMPEARPAIIGDYGYDRGFGPGRGYGYGPGYGRGYGRRGALRDILDILFLSEYYRRRRRPYYY